MNIWKSTFVVEKSTCEILYYSLISKFKQIFIELFFIGCKISFFKKTKFLNKKDILKVIHQYITQLINSSKSYKYSELRILRIARFMRVNNFKKNKEEEEKKRKERETLREKINER